MDDDFADAPQPALAPRPNAETSSKSKRSRVSSDPTEILPNEDELAADAARETADGSACTICQEQWTATGARRVVCLACGHLYCQQCITTWVRKAKSCPQCMRPAKTSDIRPIFVPNLRVVDTSEREKLLDLVAAERRLRVEAEAERAHALVEAMAVRRRAETGGLSGAAVSRTSHGTVSKIATLAEKGQSSVGQALSSGSHSGDGAALRAEFAFAEWTALQEGRCTALWPARESIVVSRRCRDGRHGVSILAVPKLQHATTIYAHRGAVRDVAPATAVHGGAPGSGADLVLSTALDRQLCVSSAAAGTVVAACSLRAPGWSCTWDCTEPNRVYAGLSSGSIVCFDLRRAAAPLWESEVTRGGVHTLWHVSVGAGAPYLLAGSLTEPALVCALPRNHTQPTFRMRSPWSGRCGALLWDAAARRGAVALRSASPNRNPASAGRARAASSAAVMWTLPISWRSDAESSIVKTWQQSRSAYASSDAGEEEPGVSESASPPHDSRATGEREREREGEGEGEETTKLAVTADLEASATEPHDHHEQHDVACAFRSRAATSNHQQPPPGCPARESPDAVDRSTIGSLPDASAADWTAGRSFGGFSSVAVLSRGACCALPEGSLDMCVVVGDEESFRPAAFVVPGDESVAPQRRLLAPLRRPMLDASLASFGGTTLLACCGADDLALYRILLP